MDCAAYMALPHLQHHLQIHRDTGTFSRHQETTCDGKVPSVHEAYFANHVGSKIINGHDRKMRGKHDMTMLERKTLAGYTLTPRKEVPIML